MSMRHLFPAVPIIIAAISVAAQARDCNEVRDEIDAKIKAKGVASYSLQIVNASDAQEGQVVGNCDLGAKRIVYSRGSAAARPLEPRFTAVKPAQPPSPSPPTPILTEAKR